MQREGPVTGGIDDSAALGIAIIIPVLDDADRLDRLLPMLARREDVGEIVVVDASRGSRADAFYARAAAVAARRVRFIGAPVAGRAAQMNLGAATTNADVYLFLHADSRLPDDDLRSLLGAVVPTPGWGRFDVRLDGERWWARMIERAMNRRSRLTGIATGDQGIFVHRERWNECGGYRDLPLMEDVDLSRRLKRLAAPACLRARITTSARRWQRHGVWRTIVLMWRLRLWFWLGANPQRLARMYRDAR